MKMFDLLHITYLRISMFVANMKVPTKLLIGLSVFLCCSTEASAADSWWDMINSFTNGLTSIQSGLIMGSRVVGIVICVIGLIMWYNKSQRNNQDIKVGQIVTVLIVGSLLVALPSFISNTSNSVGLQGSTVS